MKTKFITFFNFWHEQLGNILPDWYQQPSKYRHDVSDFQQLKMRVMNLYHAWNQKEKQRGFSISKQYNQCKGILYEILGPVVPSLGCIICTAHFMEPVTSKSQVYFLKARSTQVIVVMDSIANLRSFFLQ